MLSFDWTTEMWMLLEGHECWCMLCLNVAVMTRKVCTPFYRSGERKCYYRSEILRFNFHLLLSNVWNKSNFSLCLPPTQILVLELNDEAAEQTVEATVVDLLQGQEGFRWKGQARLDVREEPVLFPPGFQPFALVQCQPPAVVTAIALHSEWKLVAFGTSHGFGFYDYHQRNNILVKWEEYNFK